MALSKLSTNRKFLYLKEALGSTALARGSLELIWDACRFNADDYIGRSDDVERLAEWQGERGKLFKALLEAGGDGGAGFIEPDEFRPGYRVHDYFDHCPGFVKTKAEGNARRALDGKSIPDLRREAALAMHAKRREAELATCEKPNAQADSMQNHANVFCLHGSPMQTSPQPSLTLPSLVLQKQLFADANSCGGADAIEDAAEDVSASNSKPVLKAKAKSKPKKQPEWMKPHDADVLETMWRIMAIWPSRKNGDVQSNGDPVPHIEPPNLASRLADIKAVGGDLAICEAIAIRYVDAWKAGEKWKIRAPQNFFGKDDKAPWEALYKAHSTNQAIKTSQAQAATEGVKNG